ncbi:MAG: translocation/assembly module TamB domain-containing protein [Gammaproteobacteria bacterium]|nr:translocation/assembly module TamB domain-containing protein [Gammaproteobacteria bacterium]
MNWSGLFKRSALGSSLILILVAFFLVWLTATESGLRWSYQLAGPYLPGNINIDKLEGRLIGPITITGIQFQHNDIQLNAEQLTLDWQASSLLTSQIDIHQLHVQSLNITLPQPTRTEQPFKLPEIHLPWRLKLNGVLINNTNIHQAEQTFKVNQIKLDASTLFSQIDIAQLYVVMDGFEINLNGKLNPTNNYQHKLDVQWRAEFPSQPTVEGKGHIKGNLAATHIQQQISGPAKLILNADLRNLLQQLQWQAQLSISDFNASHLDASWPAISGTLQIQAQGDLTTATVSGKADGHYPEQGPFDAQFKLQRLSNNSMQIEQLILNSSVSQTHINAQGMWIPGENDGSIDLCLDWQNLRWPLQNPTWFNSEKGNGYIQGNVNNYHLNLTTSRPWPQAPPSTWQARADGNLNGLNFHQLRIITLDGEANIQGKLNWSPTLTWQAKATTSNINPGKLWPNWSGQLNANLTSTGQYNNGQWVTDTNIKQLTGKLRDYPVSLKTHLDWNRDTLNIHNFDFYSATSHISTRGRIGPTLKLDWLINTTDLAELYPQAEGQLQAQGQFTGSQTAPQVHALINGKVLRLSGYEIGRIDASVGVDIFRWQNIDIKLDAENLRFNDYILQSLKLDADTQSLRLNAVSEKATALIELKGKASSEGWQGEIQKADILSTEFSDWKLNAPASLTIVRNTILLETLCWKNQASRLCTDLKYKNRTWQASLETQQLPLFIFNPLLPPDLKLEGTADAVAELQFDTSDKIQGQLNISLPAGIISYPLIEGNRDRWEYRNAKISATLNQQGLEATSEINMDNGDRLNGKLVLPNINPLNINRHTQTLQANAQLKLHNLGIIEALLPEVQDLKGEVEVHLSAIGTLDQPQITTNAHLRNGSLRIPRLGLMIDRLGLNAQSNRTGTLGFRLDAHSGEGYININGTTQLNRNTGWPTALIIKGENFDVARIPEARVQISPDLTIKLTQRKIDVNGKIDIPYARLHPKDITTAARVSDDAIILGSKQPIEEKWKIHSNIRLTLGERVSYSGFGFDGRFTGSLLVEDEPGQPTRATGEINITEGRYNAYGQRLNVEHGRLLYTRGPLTNPGLDLRAVRHIGNITTGLKVRGNLKQPQVELFSIPAMGQTDILSYIILGRPIENASNKEGSMMAKAALALSLSGGDSLARKLGDRFGLDEMRIESSDSGDQASLAMGRYLSPKLYISYGVGLIESFNTLNVRYQISDKWQLKGVSGEHQGADLLYTIER